MTRSTDGQLRSASAGAADTDVSPDAPPRFAVGDDVRIIEAEGSGHVRTPRYVRGSRGTVTAVHGRFRNPESLGHGGDGLPERWLYQVAVVAEEMWDRPAPTRDVVCVDLFEHWLSATVPTDSDPISEGPEQATERG